MTNVSKNLLFAFSVVVSATVLSLGAFATTVHASDWSDFSDFGGGGYSDFSSYGGYGDYSSYGGDWTDYSSYGGYGDYSTYDGYSDYSSYDGYGDYNTYDGWNDYSTYGGYGDYSSYDSYNPGYYEVDSYNPGYYEVDSYNPGYYEVDSYNPGYYEVDSYNPGSYAYDSYNPGYGSTAGYTTGGGMSFGGGGTTGGGYTIPSFTSGGCTSCHSVTTPKPTYTTPGCTHNCYPQPKPQPGCTTCGGSNTNITNTNINTNTNTIIDNSITDNSINIDNSIRDSFNTTVIGDNNTVGGGYMGYAQVTTVTPVQPQHPIVYQQPAAPYCVITLTNAGVYAAQATLVWSSANAQSAYITSVGSVPVNGTRAVTGYAQQIYSLTVTGQGGTYTCNTQMFTPGYVAPQTPSVSLTQIPYTGLTMGPLAEAMYWLSLVAVAAAGAYLAVYYKGGALAFATTAFATNRSRNHFVVSEQEAEEISAPETTETETESEVSPVSTFNFLPAFASMNTVDSMALAHNADGMPKIVINRA